MVSGIPDDQIKQLSNLGVAEINVYTECQIAFANATRDQFVREYDANEANTTETLRPRKFLKPGFEAITAAVEERIDVFGSSLI